MLIIFCPKLDGDIEMYLSKLTTLFATHAIRSVTVVRMEVPCCSATMRIVEQAIKQSDREIHVAEHIISIRGELV